MSPPIDWFRNPGFSEPTPHTVDPPVEINGKQYRRVKGHLCQWTTSHVGMPGRNVTPPRSPSDYAHFHVASTEVVGDDGELTRIPCGSLTCDTGHASLEASANDAAKFYDNTGTLAASVCMGEDSIGVWYSGVVDPDLPELTLRRFSGCSQSGDWRPINGQLDLVASLSVVTPGFPIPRARVASGATEALVAAGALLPRDIDPDDIVITLPRPAEDDTNTEDAMPGGSETTETVDTTETVTASAPSPSFGKDDVVHLPAGTTLGMVASVEDGRAIVQVEVPVGELEDAGQEGRLALSASARERLMDSQLSAALTKIDEMQSRMASLVASAEDKQRGAVTLNTLGGIPE